eukprot:scaffold61249_cov64-Phaeocystis_antarctica.AAC.7
MRAHDIYVHLSQCVGNPVVPRARELQVPCAVTTTIALVERGGWRLAGRDAQAAGRWPTFRRRCSPPPCSPPCSPWPWRAWRGLRTSAPAGSG